jgi:hypothetical protein
MAMVSGLGDRKPCLDFAGLLKLMSVFMMCVLASVGLRHAATWSWRALLGDGTPSPLSPDVASRPCSACWEGRCLDLKLNSYAQYS